MQFFAVDIDNKYKIGGTKWQPTKSISIGVKAQGLLLQIVLEQRWLKLSDSMVRASYRLFVGKLPRVGMSMNTITFRKA